MDCHNCENFLDHPAAIEREFPGLNILSSAYGSVCSGSGYCRAHDRMQRSIPACGEFRDLINKAEEVSLAP